VKSAKEKGTFPIKLFFISGAGHGEGTFVINVGVLEKYDK